MDDLRWQCPACQVAAVGVDVTPEEMQMVGWRPVSRVVVNGWRVALCPRCARQKVTLRPKP